MQKYLIHLSDIYNIKIRVRKQISLVIRSDVTLFDCNEHARKILSLMHAFSIVKTGKPTSQLN